MKMRSIFAASLIAMTTILGSYPSRAQLAGGGTALKPSPEMQEDVARANEFVRAKDYPQAEKVYQGLTERFPTSAFAFHELGRCRFWQQKQKLALEAFTRASALAPNEAAPLECLGRIYHAQ